MRLDKERSDNNINISPLFTKFLRLVATLLAVVISIAMTNDLSLVASLLALPLLAVFNSELVLCHPTILKYEYPSISSTADAANSSPVWCVVLYPVSTILTKTLPRLSNASSPLHRAVYPIDSTYVKGFMKIDRNRLNPVQGDDALGSMWRILKAENGEGGASIDSLAAASDDDDDDYMTGGASSSTEIICRICRDGVLIDVEPTETTASAEQNSQSENQEFPPVSPLPTFAEPSEATHLTQYWSKEHPPKGYKVRPSEERSEELRT